MKRLINQIILIRRFTLAIPGIIYPNGYTLLKGKDKNIFTINDTDYLNYINLNKEKLSYQKVFKLNSFTYKLIENENLILKFNQDNLLVEAVLFNQ